GCDFDVDLPLDRSLDDGRLVLTRGQDRDLARLENRRNAHREGFARHEILSEEIRRRIPARDRVEHDEARSTLRTGPGLVEADVPRLADPQDLEVDTAGSRDGVLVPATLIVHVLARHLALRDV